MFLQIRKVHQFLRHHKKKLRFLGYCIILKEGRWRGGTLGIIKHMVCKIIVACDENTGCRDIEVSSIYVCHQDHIASVIPNIGIWIHFPLPFVVLPY